MNILIAGLIIFFTLHSISFINEGWRNRMAARIGEGPWKGLYALIALLGFVLMVWGYGLARQDSTVLYVSAPWLRHLVMLLLLPVFPLLLATYFPGRIKSLAKNPMLIATLLWSFAHLLVNGRLADVLLFGAFFVWAALDLCSMRRRTPRALPGAPASQINDVIALVLGLVLYGLFVFWLHDMLIGVALITPIS